ncbi:MAG TPA: fatty acid desaturase [Vineibacter sp.]|nr:fatty acid desaturase [Vineibacter sp.]
MTSRATAIRLNVGLSLAVLAVAVTAHLVVPLVVLPYSGVAAAALLGVAVLLMPLHGALLHEAVHGRLLAGERANRLIGRLLAVTGGVGFEIVRYGHLAHHRYNRHALDRPDVLEGDRPLAARIGYYFGLLGGIYLVEVASTLLSLLPRWVLIPRIGRLAASGEASVVAVIDGMQRAVGDVRLDRARIDCLCMLALYGVAFWLYGTAWPLLLALIAARALIVSVLDNAPHYGTPLGTNAPVYNLRLPRWAALLILNQNLHGTHHRRPGIPWQALPGAFAAGDKGYDSAYATAVLRQFRGPRPAAPAIVPAEVTA